MVKGIFKRRFGILCCAYCCLDFYGTCIKEKIKTLYSNHRVLDFKVFLPRICGVNNVALYIKICYTISDERMYKMFATLAGINIEFAEYGNSKNCTHIVWRQSSGMVPQEEMQKYYSF